ncbi:hypothetical protein [Deinococcus yavapaiensis]|nr:hypothetical protein [Deinococcus yavapaiensis]
MIKGVLLVAAFTSVEDVADAQTSNQTIKFSGPITITKGGTYRGNWRSLSQRVPAVTIATSQPVIIEYSNIEGRGTLIYSAFKQADVTVRNSRAVALYPNRTIGWYAFPGRFIHFEEFHNARIENNELVGTSGMYFRGFLGNPAKGQTIKVLRNRARNIDGRYSIGNGQWSKDQHRLVQFVQFNGIRGLPNAEIAWNEIINEPGKSRVEENISMYVSGGTAKSPILIHDNYIQGAFAARPETMTYSGGGMNLGDGSSKTVAGAAAFIRAYNNQIIGTTNIGIAVSAGHDIEVYNNRIVSSGYLPSGRTAHAQNVGIYIWDMPGDTKRGTFFNNVARNNLVGYGTPLRGRGTQNPYWLPNCARDARGASRCVANATMKGPITMTMERQEFDRWQAKVKAAGLRVGPSAAPKR